MSAAVTATPTAEIASPSSINKIIAELFTEFNAEADTALAKTDYVAEDKTVSKLKVLKYLKSVYEFGRDSAARDATDAQKEQNGVNYLCESLTNLQEWLEGTERRLNIGGCESSLQFPDHGKYSPGKYNLNVWNKKEGNYSAAIAAAGLLTMGASTYSMLGYPHTPPNRPHSVMSLERKSKLSALLAEERELLTKFNSRDEAQRIKISSQWDELQAKKAALRADEPKLEISKAVPIAGTLIGGVIAFFLGFHAMDVYGLKLNSKDEETLKDGLRKTVETIAEVAKHPKFQAALQAAQKDDKASPSRG